MSNDSLGDRMKRYEEAARTVLPTRLPLIIRIDGKAFHTYTQGCKTPWDDGLIDAMNCAAIKLCEQAQGTQLAYVQSDEISILIHNYKKLNSSAWFDNQVQKMVSIAAAIVSVTFTLESTRIWTGVVDNLIDGLSMKPIMKPAYFDARAYVLPESEVCNYFLWRQQDATRNSIQTLARSLASHKECENKNGSELQELCFQRGKNWNDLETRYRRGRCIVKRPYDIGGATRTRWEVDNEIPQFNLDRTYIDRFLEVEED